MFKDFKPEIKLFFLVALIAVVLSVAGVFLLKNLSSIKGIELGENFNLRIGQTLSLSSEDLRIKFAEVLEDSRCPSNVQCFWAGQVKIKVHITKDTQDIGDFELIKGSGENEPQSMQDFDEYSIQLMQIKPYPKSSGKMNPSAYIATLIVSKTASGAQKEDETANWKTYSDELVTFRYPEDWIADPVQIFGSRSEVEFKYQKTPTFILAKIANYNNGTQKPFATLEEFIGTRDRNAKEILLADQKAIYIADPGIEGHVVPYEEVVSFSPDRSFLISLYYQKAYYADFLQAYEKSRADKVLDQILSTFRFVEQ